MASFFVIEKVKKVLIWAVMRRDISVVVSRLGSVKIGYRFYGLYSPVICPQAVGNLESGQSEQKLPQLVADNAG